MCTIDVITPFYYGNNYINSLGNLLETSAQYLIKHSTNATINWHIMNDSHECDVNLVSEKEWKYLQVTVTKFIRNQGIHHARIAGLDEATGEFILFLDQDNEISKDYFVK